MKGFNGMMRYTFNSGFQYEQLIEISETMQNCVIINIARTPYNEHAVDIEISKEELREFAMQILEFLDRPAD